MLTVNADNVTLYSRRELLMKFDLNSQKDTVNHIVTKCFFSFFLSEIY